MIDLLISAILIGLATLWTVEVLDALFLTWVNRWVFTKLLSLPIAFGYGWLLNLQLNHWIIASIVATSFLLLFLKWLEKPTFVSGFTGAGRR